MTAVGRPAALFIALSVVSGCSDFNMSAPCADTGEGLLITLAGLTPGSSLDRSRLIAVAGAEAFVELGSGYNSRTCQALVTSLTTGESAQIRYEIRQAEGLQQWYEITVLESGDPLISALAQRISADYAQ